MVGENYLYACHKHPLIDYLLYLLFIFAKKVTMSKCWLLHGLLHYHNYVIFLFLKVYLFYIYVYVSVFIGVWMHMYAGVYRNWRVWGLLQLEILVAVSPDMGARNWVHILCKGSKCS